MSKFFVNKSAVNAANNLITITGDDVNHIKNVLRMTPGEAIVICDGEGTDYYCRLHSIEKSSVAAYIERTDKSKTEPDVYVILYQGIPKSDKMDFIIQKSVELGVSSIIPVINERTVLKFEKQKDAEGKRDRWQRISIEAAKQCNRGRIPVVGLPVKFQEAVREFGSMAASGKVTGIIPYERESGRGIRAFINDIKSRAASPGTPGIPLRIAVFIGPEGGFSENEVAIAEGNGIKPVTLGNRILRTETAGIAVISIIMYELGDMG